MVWPKLGMVYGGDLHGSSVFNAAQVTADLGYLKSLGMTWIRISGTIYSDTSGIATLKQVCQVAKALGFYISWGQGSDSTITSSNWAGYVSSCLALATWCQDNGVDQFDLDNEGEARIDGTSVTATTYNTYITELATSVKSVADSGGRRNERSRITITTDKSRPGDKRG
jgi:hypothetical protein